MPTCIARQAFHHWCQQDPKAEQYMTVAAVIQNVIQCYQVIYEEKESYYPDITESLFQESR